MKKRSAILFSFLLFTSIAFSQQTIKGKTVTSANGVPVPGCSIFISNTSKGTVSDKNGYFELNDIPPGKHDLVVSSIGYETNAYSFSAEQLPLQLRIELEMKVKELQNVTVEPFTEDGWNRWGKLFTENFIGTTPNASHCKIKNEKAIRFRYYKNSNRMIAYADEPIIIENKALGYRMSYQLEEFEVNFKTRIAVFFGYPFFEDISNDRKALQQKWKRNRDEAYYGSMMHFMHNLYLDSLAKNGFEVRRMVRIPNKEKERVKKIYRPASVITTTKINGAMVLTSPKNELQKTPPDSMEYYERIMQEEDHKDIFGKDLLTADSLILRTEGAYKILFFTDYLYVTYKNEMEDKDYIRFQGETRRPTFQRSYITLLNQEPVEIDVNGDYPPQDILAMAYWGWSEKMADFLPSDYKPSGD